MKCPFCGCNSDKVIDSREQENGAFIKRRRECTACSRRFTTYEYIENMPLYVIKRDGSREPFDRRKLTVGIWKACEKRPVSAEDIEKVVDDIEMQIRNNYVEEVSSQTIGELVMKKLSRLDQVAYVRFASVYRQFKDVEEFVSELEQIIKKNKKSGGGRS